MFRALKNDSYCIHYTHQPVVKSLQKVKLIKKIKHEPSNKSLKASFYYKCTEMSHTLHERCLHILIRKQNVLQWNKMWFCTKSLNELSQQNDLFVKWTPLAQAKNSCRQSEMSQICASDLLPLEKRDPGSRLREVWKLGYTLNTHSVVIL